MTELSFLIVDDEELAREKIASFLPAQSKVQAAANGIEALEKLKGGYHPDVVFLDIEMPGLNGFEFLQNLEDRPFKIIFQTAYDEFAIAAFEQNACDYLLKPFTKERLLQAIQRASAAIESENRLKDLEKHLIKKHSFLQRITVKQGAKLKVILTRDIHCFVSQDHYTSFFTREGELITDLSINRLTELLNPEEFLRVHRNAIVRRDSITEVTCGSPMKVELSNGQKVEVSRSNRRTLKDLIA